MEALRIKVDNLEWELNSLRTENRQLREDNPQESATLDELAKSKDDAARLQDRVRQLEQQLAEKTEAIRGMEDKVECAEAIATELGAQGEDVSAAKVELRAVAQEHEEELERARHELLELAERCETQEQRAGR